MYPNKNCLPQLNNSIRDGTTSEAAAKSSSEPYTLERSLALSWKLTYYGGLLLDWCHPIRRGWFSTTIRCLFIAYTLVNTLYQCFILGFRLVYAILQFRSSNINNSNYIHVILPITYLCMQPMIAVVWGQFIIFRRQLLAFFSDWVKLEQGTPMETIDHLAIRRFSRITNITFFMVYSTALCMLIGLSFTIELDEKVDLFLFYFPYLKDSFLFMLLYRTNVALWDFSTLVFNLLIDLAPVLVYYHIAKHIEAMGTEIKTEQINQQLGTRSNKIEAIWSRFEDLRALLHRSDRIFGPMIILNHGSAFFIICCNVYIILRASSIANSDQLFSDIDKKVLSIWSILPLSTLFNFSRLLFGISMIAKVQKQADYLMTTVTRVSTNLCRSPDKEGRRIIKAFASRLQSAGMIACPVGLYYITPSILLTLLSLIVTYTILLLQM